MFVSPILMIYNNNYDMNLFTCRNFMWLITFAFISFFKLVLEAKAQLLESPAKLSPLSYTTILYALVIDVFIFNETLSLYSLIGSALVVFTSYKIVKSKK